MHSLSKDALDRPTLQPPALRRALELREREERARLGLWRGLWARARHAADMYECSVLVGGKRGRRNIVTDHVSGRSRPETPGGVNAI